MPSIFLWVCLPETFFLTYPLPVSSHATRPDLLADSWSWACRAGVNKRFWEKLPSISISQLWDLMDAFCVSFPSHQVDMPRPHIRELERLGKMRKAGHIPRDTQQVLCADQIILSSSDILPLPFPLHCHLLGEFVSFQAISVWFTLLQA